MPAGKTRVAVFALIGLSALLVGFHGASTLMTLTQIGASTEKPQIPKAHASLVPRPVLQPVAEPARPSAPPADAVLKPAANLEAQPVVQTQPAKTQPVSLPTSNAAAEQPAKSSIANLAATTWAEAALIEGAALTEATVPRRERQRRYRAPRPELHRVY